MLVSVSAPPNSDRGPIYMEQVLGAVHQACRRWTSVAFLIGRRVEQGSLYCRFPVRLRGVIEGQLAAAYPDCTVTRLPEDALEAKDDAVTRSVELRLVPDLYPIRRHPQFDDLLNRTSADPLAALLTTMDAAAAHGLTPRIEMTVRPATRGQQRRARRAAERLSRPFFRWHRRLAFVYAASATSRRPFVRLIGWILGTRAGRPEPDTQTIDPASRSHDREDDVQAAVDKVGRRLFAVYIRLSVSASRSDRAPADAKLREMAAAFGQFTSPRHGAFSLSRVRRVKRTARPRWKRSFLLSAEELATLWHPATVTVRAPAMAMTLSREMEPPPIAPSRETEADVAELGRLSFRYRRQQFGIRLEDRMRHVAIMGKTGMGKSTLLHRLVTSDIRDGRGVALIDPHGDLAEAVLRSVPRSRTNDVVLFDAGDRDYPVAFNPLRCDRPDQRPLVAAAVVSAFKKLYGESWGPRLEHILRNALLALLEQGGTSLASLVRLLGDAAYRRAVVSRVGDPVVRSFWENEFARWKPQLRSEAVAPIQNKVGQFLAHPILRGIVGQTRGSLDFRQVMDEGRILVVNLSKGRIGDDASALLGSLVVTSLELAAMSRAEIPEAERLPFFCYVDEFQNFATESFATILSEARKYGLSLTIANQYLAQMEEPTLEAVFGNVGSLLVFQVGARDAEVLAQQLGGDLTPQDLMALPRYTAYVRLLIDGMPSRPFSMQTLPATTGGFRPQQPGVIRRTSRHRYARPADVVDREMRSLFAAAG